MYKFHILILKKSSVKTFLNLNFEKIYILNILVKNKRFYLCQRQQPTT